MVPETIGELEGLRGEIKETRQRAPRRIRTAGKRKSGRDPESFKELGKVFVKNRILLLRQFNCFVPVIPSKDGIHNEFGWMPDRVRHDVSDIYLPM